MRQEDAKDCGDVELILLMLNAMLNLYYFTDDKNLDKSSGTFSDSLFFCVMLSTTFIGDMPFVIE